jgi:hypothetical protein
MRLLGSWLVGGRVCARCARLRARHSTGRRHSPPLDLGLAFADGLRERFVAIYPTSPSKGRRGHEAGATAAHVHNACALDPEAGFLESGVELFGC